MKKLTPIDYWRIGLGFSALLCVSVVLMFWFSGASETRKAMANGQRVIISLSNGAIEGTQAPADDPNKDSKTKEAKAAATSTTTNDTATATAEAPENSSASTPPPSSPTPSPEENGSTPSPASTPATATETPSEKTVEKPSSADTPMMAARAIIANMAPVSDALTEKATVGPLPLIGADGTKPWRYYAKRYTHKGHFPMIGIIVTGLGQNKLVTDMAIKLPNNVSLSFNPYGHDVGIWSNSARALGHEVFTDLSMEPANYPASDPGPYGLIGNVGVQMNMTRLDWQMSRMQAYVGMVTPQNEVLSANIPIFKAVLEALNRRGIMILMSHEPAKSETMELVNNSKIPYGVADILIDEELAPASIQSRLVTLQKLASKRGYAIGVIQAYPLSIQQISDWAAGLAKDGYELAPISYLVQLKFED